MLFMYYLNELKYRLLYILLGFIFNFIVLLVLVPQETLLFVTIKPLIIALASDNPPYFIFTAMTDTLLAVLRIVFVSSVVSVIPIILVQILFFVTPALFKYERDFCFTVFGIFICIFLTTNSFLYSDIIPSIWSFFMNFELRTGLFHIYYEANIKEYVDFMFGIFMVFNGLYVFPLLMVIFIYFNVIPLSFFFYARKVCYIFILVWGGIFSPPDILSQSILVCPMLMAYEIILIIALFLYNYVEKK